MAVQKLQRCENTTFHFHAAPFGTRSRLDLSKSGISLNSRSHADNISVTQTVSVFEFISIDEML